MSKVTRIIRGGIGDTARSVALKVEDYRTFVTKNGTTADIYSSYKDSLMLLKYEEGCLKKVKLFNSCEMDDILKNAVANQ